MFQEKSISVLFVDDDEVNRYAGKRLLHLAGYDVIEAATGEEALAALDQNPDIAVIDVHLPDIDGFTLCQQVKSNPQGNNLPVLLMSATFTSTADRVQGLENGADGYLAQPFELPVLRATITAMLRMREAEEAARKLSLQWQTTFDAISDGIWILDNQGRVVRGNEAMGRLWGLSVDGLETKLVWDIMQQSGLIDETNSATDKAQTALHELFNTPDKLRLPLNEELEFKIQQRWFRVLAHSIGEGEHDGGIVQVWSDITQRKSDEQERLSILEREKDARLQAEEANRLKDEFLATLSHELRTPLMAIIGWTELLLEEFPDGSTHDSLKIIERNARTQSQIISDLLDISRVIAGKMQLQVESLHLNSIIQNALATVLPSMEAKNIQLIFQPAEDFLLKGDANRLQQVLWNLLSNAVKFTPSGGTLELRSYKTEDAVILEVQDSGQGIDTKFLPYVFDRFRQEDSSSTRRHGGLGLGLSIVRHLMEMHGGQISVDSAGIGQGTTFTIKFPLVAHRQEQANAKSAHPNTQSSFPDGLRVLVVDDQHEARLILTALLQRSSAEVQACTSAKEAFDLLQQWRPDLLISDLGMPHEDGYSLMTRIRALPPEKGGETPSLALSAYADSHHKKKALESGFDEFVPKPVDWAHLVKTIMALMQRDTQNPS
jgi:PAS domain S-box-containing protein